MPSMRLNTTSAAGISDLTEWQTVGAKTKSKKSKEEAAPEAPIEEPIPEPLLAKIHKPVHTNNNNVSDQYQPEELGSDVLSAYDQAWASSVIPTPAKNGNGKAAEALKRKPAQVATAPPAAPAENGKVLLAKELTNGTTPESKSSKKKSKSKTKAKSAPEVVNETKNGSNGAALPKAKELAKATKSVTRATKAPTTIAAASKSVDLKDLTSQVEGIKVKHPGEGVLLLQLLATWLSTAFSTVTYKHMSETEKLGLAASIQQPWSDVDSPLQDALLKWAAECEPMHSATYIVRVCEQTIANIPEKASLGVGEALVLSAACRSTPIALALACPGLTPIRSKLLAPARIPVSLWLFGQAAAGGGQGTACAVHTWSRVILPCITHQEVVLAAKPSKKASKGKDVKQQRPASVYHIEPQARDAAVAFFTDVLLADARSVHRAALLAAAAEGVAVGPSGAKEPVVPPSAVDAAAAAASGTVHTSRGTPAVVQSLQSDLEELCLCCSAPSAVLASVARALAHAENADEARDAAKELVRILARHSKLAAAAWVKSHRTHLAGSTAILEAMCDDHTVMSELVSKSHSDGTLLDALDGIQKAQASILEAKKGGKDSKEGSTARNLAARSATALQELSMTHVSVVPASAMWSMASLFVIVVAALTYSYIDRQSMQQFLTPALGADRAQLFASVMEEGVQNLLMVPTWLWSWWVVDE